MSSLRLTESVRVTKGEVEFELTPAEEGGYVIAVPAYPSCVSEGDTFEEALANIEDALAGCLAAAKDLGLPIPSELQAFALRTYRPPQ